MPPELRLGTRGSPLALWQAHAVADRIARFGGPPCRIVTIRTSGDQLQNQPLSTAGGKRLFVKEIEDSLLRGDVDLAVHSSKDMPAVLPEGLKIAATLPREDPLDAVVLPAARQDANAQRQCVKSVGDLKALLGVTPVLGTGSVRRVAQLMRLFPSARFANIRGNLDTRLRKLENGEFDALVLAAAGLRRLDYEQRIAIALPATVCIPAPGQGIVAVEIREADGDVERFVGLIDDPGASAALTAERALVNALGGGCQTPIGALATLHEGEELDLVAAVVSLDGKRAVRGVARGSRRQAAELGTQVGEHMIADGAADILADCRLATND